MNSEDLLKRYRPNVGVALFNNMGRVWLGRRVGDFSDLGEGAGDWRWQMPQGGVDAGEDIEAAAFRELAEETGVTSARLLLMTPGWLAYDFPPAYKKNNWKGQRQKWAAMLFEGTESEINLAAHHKQEFDRWRWAELEEAPQLIVPFKRSVYEDLARTLAPLRDQIRAAA
ncbi:MAG: RNA pyrophosphohydrolase [Parvularculaceae bacterium]